MKKAIATLFAIAAVAAASVFAVDKTGVPTPAVGSGIRPSLEMDHGPLPPLPSQLPPHGPVLSSVTVATGTPAETISKLAALTPTGPARHYGVHVEVVSVTGDTDGQQPLRRSPDLGTAIKKAAAYRNSFVNENEVKWQRTNYVFSGR